MDNNNQLKRFFVFQHLHNEDLKEYWRKPSLYTHAAYFLDEHILKTALRKD